MAAYQRSVLKIDHPETRQGMTPAHRVRPLLADGMRGNWAPIDPFLALMEDWFPRGVFGKHPHRGIETVTYVLEGRIDHYDNQGNEGVIEAGGAQWMTAGRGLIHNEVPAEGQTVHSLQLWINLPAADKMIAPRYQDLVAQNLPVRREPGAEVRVFSGASGGVRSPTMNVVPVTMVEFRLEPGVSLAQSLSGEDNGFIVVLEGDGAIGAEAAKVVAGNVAFLTRDASRPLSEVRIAGGEKPLRALLFAGRPLGEPVVAHGPFVMNTEAQIEQAFADYRAGRFGAA
jgi:quercetin 2,3-dioxygenase